MALETGTYISDLVVTNPPGSDAKSTMDDHLRLIKSTVKATFPNVAGAVTATHTQLSYVTGVTSAIQTQLNAKGTVSGQTWTGTHVFPATTSIGNVSATEIAYLDGVTSAIQTQLDSKGAITGQTWTGTHILPATTSIGTVSATEIGYLDGVTSAIQGQIDGKGAIAGQAWTGSHTFPTQTLGTNSTLAATTAYVDQTAFAAALPAKAVGFVGSPDGVSVSFTQTHTGYAQNEVKGANIASAATVNLTTATGNLVHITGTTTITAFTIASGAEREVVFDGVLTLTNGASLILPTGANITTAAGDCATVRGDGAAARIVKYSRADGRPNRTAALELVAALTPTAAANLDFLSAFSSTYDEYMIVGTGIDPAAVDSLTLRLAVGGAADTGSNYASAGAAPGAATSITVCSNVDPANEVSFQFTVYNCNAALNKAIIGHEVHKNNGANVGGNLFSGLYTNASTVTGFRLYWGAAANFAAKGRVKVYGIRNS